ncbi:TIGR03862 family flavoprotein [Phaeobacter sp. 22II1-1F12B]|uniref:TIGR03862 family flavoprotein n=1 Tax=Phaeobacter sp. 22II1-1F12B TaxID=1317111 RepID=UPI000B526587|nr:TIGR03862 family flavoprotein [Phaeobacter sp. 22II1-1F12B]OWU80947.1 NAD(FAD)-utilizing dehydrogenase [Phaeobacter sp. 22II1-1F12B]
MSDETGEIICDALVIGGGPAGLMAAGELSRAGHKVLLAEAKPSIGRKFLMAGKSGLNLTKVEERDKFMAAYGEAAAVLERMLDAFGPDAVQEWAQGLGQPVFTGSTGRVFPEVMKASPLLRAWLQELAERGVETHTRWRWGGCDEGLAVFETPDGSVRVRAKATVLAMGGASWKRLGSDGLWADVLAEKGVNLEPFAPANAGICVDWSPHMAPYMGQPLKNVAIRAGAFASRGEAVISGRGLEGGGIYSVSRGVREGGALTIDLLPDQSVEDVAENLSRPRGKASLSNHLRKRLKLSPVQIALLNEFARPFPDESMEFASRIKAVPVRHGGFRPMDEAISTAGGVAWQALDDTLMLRELPGVFCAGEMIDWEAPTGGYLLTACLATGRWVGRAASDWLVKR